MSKKNVKDVPASVRARLTAHAKTSRRPFQEVLQYFAMERFLYRVSISENADKFVLKGGLMFAAWATSFSRPTKDIDLLAYMANDVETAGNVVKDICNICDESDGIDFDADSVETMVIKEDAEYEGVRVTFKAELKAAKIHMQIDMGFGDVVTPEPQMLIYPTILDHTAPKLLGYPAETVIAEKFEAMVKLGQLNSRIRDFYDVWSLSRQFDFDGEVLRNAIVRTFANRETDVIVDPVAFQSVFTLHGTKQKQWDGFCRKSRIELAPKRLDEIVAAIAVFLSPIADSIVNDQPFVQSWKSGGPWQA